MPKDNVTEIDNERLGQEQAQDALVRSRYGLRIHQHADLTLSLWGWQTNNHAECVKATRPPRCSLGQVVKRSISQYTSIDSEVGKVDISDEDVAKITGLVKKLSEDYRKFVELYYRNKLTQQQICLRLNVSRRTCARLKRDTLDQFILLGGNEVLTFGT